MEKEKLRLINCARESRPLARAGQMESGAHDEFQIEFKFTQAAGSLRRRRRRLLFVAVLFREKRRLSASFKVPVKFDTPKWALNNFLDHCCRKLLLLLLLFEATLAASASQGETCEENNKRMPSQEFRAKNGRDNWLLIGSEADTIAHQSRRAGRRRRWPCQIATRPLGSLGADAQSKISASALAP